MKKTVRRGFTLPEVLVTVTVVAVLAAVVVPAVTQYVSKGDAPASQQDLEQVRGSITAYLADTRHYPKYFSDLTATTDQNGYDGYKGPYLASGVAGGTGTGYFTSTGLSVKLGGAFDATTDAGYFTTPLAFTGSATCKELWALDKSLDKGPGDQTGAGTGSLRWTTGCTLAGDSGNASTTATITLRLMTIGQ